jgi:flagellar biosynthesis GTPase FlhF
MSDEEVDYEEEPTAEEAEEEVEETEADAEEEAEAEDQEEPAEEEAAEEEEEEPEAEEEPVEDEKEAEPEAEAAPTSYDEPTGDYTAESAWQEIAKDENAINWYAVCLVDGKKLTFDRAGSGGLAEVAAWLEDQGAKILFVLLRVNPGDSSGSKRAKFVFIKFIGASVGVMQKAKAGTKGREVDVMFPVKHISLELSNDEHLAKQLSMEQVTKEFLRVGGAHKPEFYEFGPGQRFALK